ncbi:DUF3540 domain-containing protein [Chondromyces apiculatus]|uniref:DUF3540 domain-containing protein n=1 Tax=Chondromyces apiculatus DSM 436 TaxID=1192034 RepID=A0A017T1Q2_9BACT|nr:DUF3540 domain-containing protein [Chondromyces apiculatus]EYF03143.1 Hypothetical protein CAP_6119 [Chondromyces apiculatus DSM 436]
MSVRAIKKSDASLPSQGDVPRTEAGPALAAVAMPAATSSRAVAQVAQVAQVAHVRDYLGPATVVAVEEGTVTVALPGEAEPIPVELAFTLPYEPALADTLLVIGRGEKAYAIGVLHGTGRTVLSLQGDVELHARDGALSLSGDKGVKLRGPELEVEAGKVRMVADAVVQKFNSVYQRVSTLLSVRAQEAHTVIEKTSFTQAKNASILTEETVTVNGKQVLLG